MAEQTDSKVPQIRFEGFDGEWDTCRLDEAATVERGKFSARPRNDPKYFGGDVPFVQTGDVVSAPRILKRFTQTLNPEGLAVSKSFPKNSILMTIAANIGDLAITDFRVACPDSVVAINAYDDFDTGFIFTSLGIKKPDLEKEATTNAQANINLKILNPLTIVRPTLPEQTKIGGYFKELDGMIGLHQRKHGKLVTLKQAMLQKMFPQNGATTPEIRFKGFSEPWVEKKLGELGVFLRGISYNSTNVSGSGLLVLRSSNIQNYKLNLRSDLQFIDLKCPEEISLQQGDIAICMSNGSKRLVGKSAVYSGSTTSFITVGAFCSIFRSPSNLAPYLLQSVGYSKHLEVLLAGTSINNLKNSDLAELVFGMPSQEAEQQKIGTYFRQLDTLISKHATQLEKLKQLKSACLEKMFV